MRVPRQHSSNCWLNAAIMSFFVSDGMHRTTRSLRAALTNPPSTLPAKLRPELRQLGLAIHSVPLGILTRQYSTAALIPALQAADKAGLTTPRNRLGASPGAAHNPAWFLTALASLLLPLRYPIARADLTAPGGSPHRTLSAALAAVTFHNATKAPSSPPPRLLLVEAGQETAGSKARAELNKAIAEDRPLEAFGQQWKLDSLAMMDTGNSHFGGVITCGNAPYTYDGMTGSRVHPKRTWRQVMDQLTDRPIPTPSREEFRYDIRTGYVVFAFVPLASSSGHQR